MMVGESEVSVVLTLTKAVNELIQLNLHLYFFEDGDYTLDGKKSRFQRFTFEQSKDGDFDVVLSAADGKVQFVDFVNLKREGDTHALYSCVMQENMSEEEACKFIRHQFYSMLQCFYADLEEENS